MGSKDADPKPICSLGMRELQGPIGSGEIWFSRG